MRIKNPKFKNNYEKFILQFSVVIKDYIAAIPVDVEFVTFDKIRSDVIAMNLPGITISNLNDGILKQIARENNIKVES